MLEAADGSQKQPKKPEVPLFAKEGLGEISTPKLFQRCISDF